tara:strand:+ start:8031 stop:9026 length:996 start_codon:yes stop_codon:yes gene_type:complete
MLIPFLFCLSLVLFWNKSKEKVLVLIFTFLISTFIFAQTTLPVQELQFYTKSNTALAINLSINIKPSDSNNTKFEITKKPTHGSLNINGLVAVYKPKNNYNGIDFFSYSIYSNDEDILQVGVKIYVETTLKLQTSRSNDSIHRNHHIAILDTLFRPQSEDKVFIPILNKLKIKTNVNFKKLPFLKKSAKELQVLFILGTDCPISQKYMTELKNLYKKYQGDVDFYGIVPSNYSKSQIKLFKKAYAVPFDILKDKNNEYAKELGATVTPEAYLLNRKGEIHYYGAINNWFYELGKNRRVVTEHYLNDAIKAVLVGEKVTINRTTAVGCFIEF